MPILFDTAAAIAAPIVKHYHSDLEHDRLSFERAAAGHAFLWAPRECGTQLVSIWPAPADCDAAPAQELLDHDKAAAGAVEWFDAAESCFARLQWYLVRCDGNGAGSIRKIATTAARDMVTTTAARAAAAYRKRRQLLPA